LLNMGKHLPSEEWLLWQVYPFFKEDRIPVNKKEKGGERLEKLVYSVKEVIELTGLSKSTVYELMRAGEMPSVQLSERRKGVPRKELELWLKERTRKAI